MILKIYDCFIYSFNGIRFSFAQLNEWNGNPTVFGVNV